LVWFGLVWSGLVWSGRISLEDAIEVRWNPSRRSDRGFSNSDSARLTDLEVKLQAPLLIASAMITEFSKVDDTLAVRVNQHI